MGFVAAACLPYTDELCVWLQPNWFLDSDLSNVAVIHNTPPPAAVIGAPPAAEPAEARLTKLNEMKQWGLVTEEEYNKKRAEILDTV